MSNTRFAAPNRTFSGRRHSLLVPIPRQYSTIRRGMAPAAAALLLVVTTCGCAQTQPMLAPWTAFSPGGRAEVGSAEWWAANKSQAEFVPGSGYRIAGVDGYFDKNGRPIDAPIAPVHRAVEEKPSILGDFQPSATIDRVMTAVNGGPDESEARQIFAEGRELYDGKKYSAAAKRFQTAAARWPGSEVEQDALFLRAESLFFSDEYPAANDAYLQLIKAYPNTKYLDTTVARQAAIARYWQQKHEQNPSWPITPNLTDQTRPRFDTLGHAIRTYENIRMNDPTGPLADDALMAAANAYFFRGRYEDADYHYEQLRREYPNSDHQFEAHLLGLQCKLRMYHGPEYDATPLEEAEQLVKQLRVQFASQLTAEERRRVEDLEARIRQNWARRDLQMAQFYENRSEYGAARYYYAQVIDSFPQSDMAQESRTRLAAIAEHPAQPPEKLGWLMQYLPESREDARLALPAQEAPVRR